MRWLFPIARSSTLLTAVSIRMSSSAAFENPETIRNILSSTRTIALVGASALIAIVASTVALWLAFNLRGKWQMLGSALVMGVAVCGMHYTGMQAATFVPDAQMAATGGLSGPKLGMGIFAVTTVLLAVVLCTSLLRHRQRALVQI